MSDRHRTPPITFRPPPDMRRWLEAVADATDKPVGTIVNDALREYRERLKIKEGNHG